MEKELILNLIWVLTFIALVGAVATFWARKRFYQVPTQKDKDLSRLEEVIKSAELTNNSFFRSLELVQKNLETLLARAEGAEQRLRSLMLQPGMEKKEQYAAAALLLGEGKEPERIASMLGLPLAQVQIVHELQKLGNKERRAPNRKKRDEEPANKDEGDLIKTAAPREKVAPRPILLVDAIRNAASGESLNGHGQGRFNGVSA